MRFFSIKKNNMRVYTDESETTTSQVEEYFKMIVDFLVDQKNLILLKQKNRMIHSVFLLKK